MAHATPSGSVIGIFDEPQRSLEEKTARFNALLVESIDEAITALLGHQVAEALFAHLETFHSVAKDQVPYRLDAFLSALEKTFGLGAKTVEKCVARIFYSKLGLEFFHNPQMTLLDRVAHAKMKLQKSNSEHH